MKAKLIKTRDDGFLTYVLKGEDKRTIAMTRYPFPSESVYLAESHGIKLQKLSPENCDEIFGVFDVEKLIKEADTSHLSNWTSDSHEIMFDKGFKMGFAKKAELNKDKVFTLEDMRKAIAYGESVKDMDEGKIPYKTFDNFIQSLQQPTEIEVMVEMDVKDCIRFCEADDEDKVMDLCSDGCIKSVLQPKLDSNGCLILKRVV